MPAQQLLGDAVQRVRVEAGLRRGLQRPDKENMTGTSRDCFGHAEWKSAHVQQELAELLDVGDVRLVGDALQLVRP